MSTYTEISLGKQVCLGRVDNIHTAQLLAWIQIKYHGK